MPYPGAALLSPGLRGFSFSVKGFAVTVRLFFFVVRERAYTRKAADSYAKNIGHRSRSEAVFEENARK